MTTNRPLRVFLCHSSADKPAVRELYQKLRAEPWIQPWLDEEELFPGMDWNLEIEKAIEATDVILVCLSNSSITKEGYVQREIRIALDYADYKPDGTLFIIPVRLEECTPPKRLSRWQYADYFEGQRGRAFERLLISMKRYSEKIRLQENQKEDYVKKDIQDTEKESQRVNMQQKLQVLNETESVVGMNNYRLKNQMSVVEKIPKSGSQKEVLKNYFSVIASNGENRISFSWWVRLILGLIFGAIVSLIFEAYGVEPLSFLIVIAATTGLSGLLVYPHKRSLALLALGFIIFGIIFYFLNDDILSFFLAGVFWGFPFGALISRVLYWVKVLK